MPEIPDRMQAVALTGHGGLDKLVFHDDWPTPRPAAGEYSKGVSDATTGDAFDGAGDQDATWGGASISFPRIQGADVCGRVVALGEGADPALAGRRVLIDTWLRDWDEPLNMNKCGYYGSECDGGFAQYTKAPVENVHPIESDLPDEALATFATAYITAENMLNRAGVGDGDNVLIPGASGGVGSALIQLCKRRGATTIALCGEEKADQVRQAGADHVLARSPQNLAAALESATGVREVSVVADVVGGALWPQLIDALARGGRYTCAGAIAGPIVEFDLRTFYLKDLTFTGATVVPPGVFADLVGYIERGEIKPLLAAAYPLASLREAQEAFIAKKHVGNIVVVP